MKKSGVPILSTICSLAFISIGVTKLGFGVLLFALFWGWGYVFLLFNDSENSVRRRPIAQFP